VVDKYGGKMDIITADGGLIFLSISIIRDKHDGAAQVFYGLYSKKETVHS
jgi:hypothetical protein